eukprot:TCONS_00070039-protein
MNRLKKLEAYVVSTMDDNQRTSLLDNLALVVEKVIEDGQNQKQKPGSLVVDDQNLVNELSESILQILEHELKTTNNNQKPSFWSVAEEITPKDTIQMIYRLNIQQTDKNRCLAWLKLSLKEATISSFLALLVNDNQILKDKYKTSAFVRDKMMMDASLQLIEETMSIEFSVSIEDASSPNRTLGGISPETPQEITYTARRASTTSITSTKSIDAAGRKKRRGRGTSVIATIADSNHVSSSWTPDKPFSTQTDTQISSSFSDSLLRMDSIHGNVIIRQSSTEDANFLLQSYSPSKPMVVGSLSHSESSPFKEVIPHNHFQAKTKTTKVDKDSGVGSFDDSVLPKKVIQVDSGLTPDSDCLSNETYKNDIEANSDTPEAKTDTSESKSDTPGPEVEKDTSDVEKDTSEANSAVKNSSDFLDNTHSINEICASFKGLENEDVHINKTSESIPRDNSFNESIESKSNELPTINKSTTKENDSDPQGKSNKSDLEDKEVIISDKQTEPSITVIDNTDNVSRSSPEIQETQKINQNEPLNDIDDTTKIDSTSNELSEPNMDNSQFATTDSTSSNETNIQDPTNELVTTDSNFKIQSTDKASTPIHQNESNALDNKDDYDNLGIDSPATTYANEQSNNTTGSIDDLNFDQDHFQQRGTKKDLNYENLDTAQEHVSRIKDSIEEPYGLPISAGTKTKSPSGGSQQMVDVLRLSTSARSVEDYFIPGITASPPPTTESDRTSSNVDIVRNNRIRDFSRNEATGMLPSSAGTLGSSFGSNTLYSDSEGDSVSEQSFSILADLGITDDFIGMKEDHFSTDSFMGFSSTEELENAIATCKQLIKQTPEKSTRKKDLVQQLIQLRLKLHEIKEKPSEVVQTNVKKVLGHHFLKPEKLANSIPCDACSSTIYPMLQTVYMCRDCGFHCHRKCLRTIDKGCIFGKQTINSTCETRICPQISLAQQQFRCADCHQRLHEVDGHFEAILCDYTGKRYCPQCHWNETVPIPARIIHNWDFTPQKVSRQSKQLLQLRNRKADINLQKLNPALFNFLDELRSIKVLREQLIMMKEYLRTCRIATEERMLLQVQNRQHFVENSDIYSLQDLLDIHSNVLFEELSKKLEVFRKHIKKNCPLCSGKGFICEKCHSDDIIFPFDDHVISCKCKATFHRACFTEGNCPRCIRTAKRKSDKHKNEDERHV